MESEKAKVYYEKHLKYMRNYNKNHKNVINDRAKKYYQKIKEDPEKYKLYLERRKNNYKRKNETKTENETENENEIEIQIVENDE